MKDRIYIKDLKDHVGKEIVIAGWVDVRLCRAKYRALAPTLSERARRIWAATEARAAALACGIPPEQLEFMNLRFYQTGTVTKAPIQKDMPMLNIAMER